MKVCGALYILTNEYNYKVIIGCDIILQEYYITDRHRCENTKRHYMNSTKSAHELQKKNSKAEQKGLEGKDSRWSADDSCFHCASLISNRENP